MDQGEELEFHRRRPQRRAVSIGIVLLAFFNLCLLAFIFIPGADTREVAYEPQPTARVFLEKDVLDDLSSAGDAAWNNLTSATGGLILTRPDNVDDNGSEASPEQWGVSMFHGLHCLQMLRVALAGKMGASSDETHVHGAKRDDHSAHMDMGHLSHCLAYLAEAITCQGDSTLEPSVTKTLASGKSITGINGLGLMHQCRDTTWLSQAVEYSDGGALREPWKWWPGQRLEDVISTQGQ